MHTSYCVVVHTAPSFPCHVRTPRQRTRPISRRLAHRPRHSASPPGASTAARTRAATFSRLHSDISGPILLEDVELRQSPSSGPYGLALRLRLRGAQSGGGQRLEEAKASPYLNPAPLDTIGALGHTTSWMECGGGMRMQGTSSTLGPRAGPTNRRQVQRSVLLPAFTSASQIDPAPVCSSTTCCPARSGDFETSAYTPRRRTPLPPLDVADVYLHRLDVLTITLLHIVVFHSAHRIGAMSLPP
ncbi:hypothetical protein MSAN_02412300 [Mycena sanguinolenta]|uniref:Uncharacterized protein n=1 Tax=Mycena sanguinolenta TaxID=230812 RepID=A0A8H6X3Z9_9AGAR|nr:hypothetical protein MSAN_02412300 [Mycena sanguinolenta]